MLPATQRARHARHHVAALRLAAGAGLALLGITAQAATAASADEVLVTSTRMTRHAFDVPAAIDVVAIDERPDALGANPSEYLAGVAGLMVRDRATYAQEQQIAIRGFGARAQFGIVGLRLIVDGIPATMPDGQGQASHFNFSSAERFEVLRGPYSVLYGNASGGVIQLFTAAGSGPARLRGTVVGGSYDTWRASLNLRGSSRGVGYNLDYTRFRTDGARAHGAALRDTANLRLDFEPRTGNRLTLIVNRLSSPYAYDAGALNRTQFDTDATQVAPSALQFDTHKALAQTQAGIVDEQRLGERQVLRLAGYAGVRRVNQYLATSRAAQASALSAGGVVDLHNRYGGVDLRWTLATRLADRPFTLVAGANWDTLLSQRRGYNNFDGATDGVRGILRRDEDNQLYDLDEFVQAEWQFAPHWSLLAGLRHSDVRFDSDDHYIIDSADPATRNPDDSGRTRFTAWTPAASLLWRAAPDVNLYASFGRGFDTPTFDNLAYRSDGVSGLNLALAAAHTGNAELGARWRLGEVLYARGSLFYSATRDEIAVESSAGGRSTYQNAGRTRRRGAEFELDATLGRRWQAQASYTLLDARYRDSFRTCTSNVCPPGSGPIVPAGKVIPGAPRGTAWAALRWGTERGFSAAFEGSYVGRVPVNDFNTAYAPPYGLAAISAGYLWRPADWSLRLYARVDNLFDRRHASAVIINDNFGRHYLPGAGRSAYLGFSLASAER